MLVQFVLAGIVLGSMVIIFSVSPYFGIFGVLLQAISLAILLCYFNHSLVALLLVIVYIGGMMVVFLFSTILCAEPYPRIENFNILLCFFGVFGLVFSWIWDWLPQGFFKQMSVVGLGTESGYSDLFYRHWVFTCFIGIVLLVALAVVLVLGFAHKGGTLRKL
uniref:NADH-ubiquinone oxidoreductase chain 6 n=1 Tax=Ophiomastix mixta TaxID=2705303 RepID=A0A6C0FFK2_9ECHI|nr:NADH dehydrogenase subunit 6 [Ophiomastix mixta]QHT54191.1 NADH dehydrogenase subunit 6 [Ophiomastix mixta]